MSTVKSLQQTFLQFIQSYKNLFNTTYGQLQQNQNPQSQELMLERKILVENLYLSYRNVINTIDSLEQISTQTEKVNGYKQKINQNGAQINEVPQIGSHSSGNNIGGLNSVESKYDKYERQICEGHDKAVHRYKKAIVSADVWKQKLYTFINENLPSGNH